MVICSTKEELKSAMKRGESEIEVVGKLAKNIKTGKKVAFLGPVAIGALTVALATIPATGGLSTPVVTAALVAPIAAKTGLDTAIIIAAASVGVTLIIAIFRDYDVDIEGANNGVKVRMRKKR